jgi:hypothetical protein
MGGMMNHGYQCGMLWGATLAGGAQAYRLYGTGPQAEAQAIIAAQKLVESFSAYNKNEINCLEISELNMQGEMKVLPLLKFFIKGGPVMCMRMAVKYGPKAFNEIDTVFSEGPGEALSPPVSCASMLAQNMGVSEMHTVMVAGLAGGIGLSGGGCGALGAAIWLNSAESVREGASNKVINKRASDIIDKFIRSANFEVECSEIVRRKFESIGDHADYLRDGGCAEIIKALAAKSSEA